MKVRSGKTKIETNDCDVVTCYLKKRIQYTANRALKNPEIIFVKCIKCHIDNGDSSRILIETEGENVERLVEFVFNLSE